MTDTSSLNCSPIPGLLSQIHFGEYARTRNYLTGAVTKLSRYISHGALTLTELFAHVRSKSSINESKSFIHQLCWREYFQRIHWDKGDSIWNDIRHPQQPVIHKSGLPKIIADATSGIAAVDQSLLSLFAHGYMHNHARLWTASLCCNIGGCHWRDPAKWMFYHLLDGDIASNCLSWQWVAGTFSSKKYFANQENINRYSGSVQRATPIDVNYERLTEIAGTSPFDAVAEFSYAETVWPANPPLNLTENVTLLYSPWTLDASWKKHLICNRVLIIEPSFFKHNPISPLRRDWILTLASNIENLQIYVGEVHHLHLEGTIYKKEHPLTQHFPGIGESRDSIFQEVRLRTESFTPFWKQCEKLLLAEH